MHSPAGGGHSASQRQHVNPSASHILSQGSTDYWGDDDNDEAYGVYGLSQPQLVQARPAVLSPRRPVTPSKPTKLTYTPASSIRPELIYSEDLKLDVSTRYVRAISSNRKVAYVAFCAVVDGIYLNWTSLSVILNLLRDEYNCYKGYTSIQQARSDWHTFCHEGIIPKGLSEITPDGVQDAADAAATKVAELVDSGMQPQLLPAPPPDVVVAAHPPFTPGPPSTPHTSLHAPATPHTPSHAGLYSAPSATSVRRNLFSPAQPASASRHAAPASTSSPRVPAAAEHVSANITANADANANVDANTNSRFAVVTRGRRPGVYLLSEAPSSSMMVIANSRADANQGFVDAYMAGNVVQYM